MTIRSLREPRITSEQWRLDGLLADIRRQPIVHLKRHLIFHCFPCVDVDWRAICNFTFRYRNLFDGRVLVSIMSGSRCENTESVIEWFQQFKPLEITVVKNRPQDGINSSFRDQIRDIRSEDGIVFKSHTKGASHSEKGRIPELTWCENMAHGCLDDMTLIEQVFRAGYRSFGAFRTTTKEGEAIVNNIEKRWPGFHYPGAFYWFNPKFVPDSFSAAPQHHYENEEFPCVLGPVSTCFCPTIDNVPFR